jgi:hypothetical protein
MTNKQAIDLIKDLAWRGTPLFELGETSQFKLINYPEYRDSVTSFIENCPTISEKKEYVQLRKWLHKTALNSAKKMIYIKLIK